MRNYILSLLPHKQSHKIYSNILFSITIVTIFIVILTSSILYLNFERILQYQIYSSERSSLEQASYSAEVLSEYAKTIAMQVYFDRNITRLRINTQIEPAELNAGVVSLANYKSISSFLYSVYVYNANSDLLYTSFANSSGNFHKSAEFFDTQAVDMLKNYSKYPGLFPFARSIPISTTGGDILQVNGYTAIFYESPGKSQTLSSAVILNISESWMKHTVNRLNTGTENSTFILDRKGKLVISSEKKPMLTDMTDQAFTRRILERYDISDYFVDGQDGKRSLIIHVPYKELGWIFVRTVPYDQVIRKINNMKLTTLFVAILILLFGMLASLLQSRKLFKPIHAMIDQLEALKTEKRNSHYTLKQEYLRCLLLEKPEAEYQYIKEAPGATLFTVAPDQSILVVLLKIDHYIEFCSKFNLKDRSLMKFGILNIAGELCSTHFSNDAVDMGEDHVLLLLTFREGAAIRQVLEEILQSAQEHISNLLQISVSAVVSNTGGDIGCLSELYQETLAVSYYRMLHGHRCILWAQELQLQKIEGYVYPVEKEKHLVEALITGNIQESKEIYRDVIEEACSYSLGLFKLTLTHLAFAVNTAIDMVEKNSGYMLSGNFHEFVTRLSHLETLEEINERFFSLLDLFALRLEEKRQSKYDKLVDKIIELIGSSYTDYNLSVQSIADTVNMTPAYISSIFKKHTTKSIVNYINEVRMNKAQELLRSTDMNINEIVFHTGYTNSQYFNKVFKKTYGVTPSEFRVSK